MAVTPLSKMQKLDLNGYFFHTVLAEAEAEASVPGSGFSALH